MKRTFTIRALWDDEVSRWYSQSDIDGLHIETDTLDEFEAVINEHAADLILANHVRPDDLRTKPLLELIPAIVWQKPAERAVDA
ncbi:MAG: DUF1902 domain-containing protein [Litorimonas sp.]